MLKQFHPCDWACVVKDFEDLVYDRVFEKMPYKLWREFDSALKDYNIENVRVYWTQVDIHTITIYFDTVDGKTLSPYAFDSNDNSFGSFLYENYLYGDELQMKVKDNYSEWQTYSTNTNYDKSTIEEYLKNITITYNDPPDVEFCTDYNSDVNINTTKNDKENAFMKFNFDFGPINSQVVRMSMYGLAVKNKAGTWVSYDTASGNIIDVDVFNFDGAKFLYKMPVAIKDIAAGDVVIHNGAPMFVLGVGSKTLTVVDVISGERKDIMLATSPFGFNFATKVVNFLGNMMTGTATADSPFGNMWMLMAMSGDNKMEDMLPMALMAGGNMDMSNPMMMWALMGNRTNDPMMLAMAMGAFNKPAAPAHTCSCGGNCGHTQVQN